MMKRLKNIMAFLLVFILIATMVPAMPVEAASSIAETAETTIPTEETLPPETPLPEEDTIPDEPEIASYSIDTASENSTEEYGIMTAAATSGSILLFDYSGYTTMLNHQLEIKYKPNGAGSSTTAYLQNLGWHFARYNNIPYHDDPIYCIEPNVSYGASTSGNYMDTGVTVSGSGTSKGAQAWYSMPLSYRRAITLILLYSDQLWNDSYSVATTYRDSNPNTPLRLATQFIIYEVVTGIRNAESFECTGNGYENGDVFYDAGCQVSGFSESYNTLESYVKSAMLLPSFVGSSSGNAPLIDLDDTLTWLHDDNDVLSYYTFYGDANVNFNIYGSDMCIEQLGPISSSKVYTCQRRIPSPDNSTVALYYDSTSSYQTCVKLDTPSSGNLTGYIKLNAPELTGNLNITKTTSNNQNLANWQFGIYSNSACTALVAGPYSTNSSGKISISGLEPRTYYIKEIGNTNSSITALYNCTTTNPRSVTITAGYTTNISFTNTLKPGSLSIQKTTSDGKNLAGWQFSLYSNSACTALISGPHSTNSSGSIAVSNLTAGTYYIKEIGHTDPNIAAAYTCSSSNPQAVVISAGSTSSVSFTNTLLTGTLVIQKNTSDGNNLSSWQFSVYSDQACTSLVKGTFVTNASGKTTISGLAPGTYYVKEHSNIKTSISAKYSCTSDNPQVVTITAGKTSNVSFVNTLKPSILLIQKTTSDGANLSGWKFGVYVDPACNTSSVVDIVQTSADGSIRISGLDAGTYYVKELGHSNADVQSKYTCTNNPQSVVISDAETTNVSFENILSQGRIMIRKKTNTGNHLDGWVFRVVDSEWNEIGDFTTNENGYVVTGYLPEGRYYVQELPTDDYYWKISLGSHEVTVEAGEISVDEWLNVEQGLARIYKETNTGNSVSGWEITLYSDAACTQEIYTLTTNEDGYAGYYMDPGTYWAKETGDTNGRFENEYWLIDDTVYSFEVKPHEDTSVRFVNTQYGKLKIVKTVTPDGSLEVWRFKVTDDAGEEIPGSPFSTAADGSILTGNLSSGQYTVEELLPEGSPYICDGANPQTVTVVSGQTAKVSFNNTLASGKIVIHKISFERSPLAGAKFKLEWSEDGSIWWPVTYSDGQSGTRGGCNNPNVEDGSLVSGEDGLLEWGDLHPGLLYRVTELEAPDGYVLLEDYAFQGALPQDDLTLELNIINCHGFTLPDTGADSMLLLQSLAIIIYVALIILSFWDIRRKELK